MRIAIVSDIHSNLEALEAAMAIIETKSIDTLVCLGDTVGYGANPNECLTIIRNSADLVLLGNHDEAAIQPETSEQFTPHAQKAARWTGEHLSDDHKEFLRTLPHSATLGGLLFAHSSPYRPEEWHYILSIADAHYNFSFVNAPVAFIGHTHVPAIYCEDLWGRDVTRGVKAIVNVGSVGQPRDHDWRLSFGIFDTGTWNYENIRAEYDVRTASSKILAAGLPAPLADRILVGR